MHNISSRVVTVADCQYRKLDNTCISEFQVNIIYIIYSQLRTFPAYTFFFVSGDTYRSQSTVYAFYTGQVTTIKSSFNSITWNNHTIADYQNSLKSNKNYIEYCFGGTVRQCMHAHNIIDLFSHMCCLAL